MVSNPVVETLIIFSLVGIPLTVQLVNPFAHGVFVDAQFKSPTG